MATDNAAQSNYETLDTAQLARSFNQKNLQQQYHRATAFRLQDGAAPASERPSSSGWSTGGPSTAIWS